MKFFTKHRYGVLDIFFVTIAVQFAANDEWLLCAITFVGGAILTGILESIYGTK